MTKIAEMRDEIYFNAEDNGEVTIGDIKFDFQPMEDCLPEFYITNVKTGEFLGSDLTPDMFKRYVDNKELRKHWEENYT